MPDMIELLNKIYQKNQEFEFDQVIAKGKPPESILMIDGVTRKPLSPQMRDLYNFALTWKEGLTGQDVVDPNTLAELYETARTKRSLELTAQYMGPIPPSDPSDWQRTAILAVSEGGQDGFSFFWWKSEHDIEPCVIFISGGTVEFYADLNELVEYLANGTFPEQGDAIYTRLEEERGS